MRPSQVNMRRYRGACKGRYLSEKRGWEAQWALQGAKGRYRGNARYTGGKWALQARGDGGLAIRDATGDDRRVGWFREAKLAATCVGVGAAWAQGMAVVHAWQRGVHADVG